LWEERMAGGFPWCAIAHHVDILSVDPATRAWPIKVQPFILKAGIWWCAVRVADKKCSKLIGASAIQARSAAIYLA
jgi:hypothetical protein